jgi:hypothetical protein
MWKKRQIFDDRHYVLSLCQSKGGTRFFVVSEVGEDVPDLVFQTQEIAPALLRDYAWRAIEEQYTLSNGEKFVFGPHGEWFTLAEEKALGDPFGKDPIPWATPVPPSLPPK